MGKQDEKIKQQRDELDAIAKANTIRDNLKRDSSYAERLRKHFTR